MKKEYNFSKMKRRRNPYMCRLKTLIAQESGRRLGKLGGTEKSFRPVPRRKS